MLQSPFGVGAFVRSFAPPGAIRQPRPKRLRKGLGLRRGDATKPPGAQLRDEWRPVGAGGLPFDTNPGLRPGLTSRAPFGASEYQN